MRLPARMAVLLLLSVVPARAQQTPRPAPRDTAAADTAAADTLPTPAAPDSVLQRLLGLPGYTATEYAGDSAVYRASDETLRLRGNAEVVYGSDRLTADSILFRERSQRVEAYGNPKVTGGAQEITGDQLFYDLERRRVTVQGGQTEFAQGANWIVKGDLTAPAEGTRFYASDILLTTDDRPEPQYHFRVGRLYVLRDRILVGRPAWLYFGDVPVFPLPFVFQNLEKGRASGVLVPRFGINDLVRTGGRTTRQISNVGYYWAINDYLGAEVSGEWRSGSYTALLGGVDWVWKRQFLNGSFNYQQFWRENDTRERSMSGNGSWRPDERTSLSASGSYASSSQFVRRESLDPLETVQNLNSSFSLNRRFDWGNLDFGATRSQQVASGRTDYTLPQLGISVTPVPLFGGAATLSGLSFTFRRQRNDLSPDYLLGDTTRADSLRVLTTARDREQIALSTGPQLTVGNLSIGTQLSLNRETQDEVGFPLLGTGELPDLSRIDRDRGTFSSSVSYRQTLIGSTTLAPTVQISQELISDTTTGGEYLFGPRRVSVGASLNTDLYGFFPGVGPYSGIRHHFKPSVSYAYTPEVTQTAAQELAFGRNVGRARNVVQVGFTNTFEAKLRDPERPEPAAVPDSLGAGLSAADSVARAAPPPEAQKVTILALNTSALEYDFIQAAEDGNGFRTEQITNTVTSDYLNGLNLSFTHSLFGPAEAIPATVLLGRAPERGGFDPQLSSVNTSFSFGQGSALFRWLGLGPRDRNTAPGAPGLVPDSGQAVDPAPRRITATGNPQGVGGSGPWRASVQYSFTRLRPTAQALQPAGTGETQTLNGNLNFSPTRNWAVNWTTSYSLTDGEFNYHSLRLRRNLYRWQANFDFYRTPTGNTSFEFSANLIDLPELRIPFRERNIGADDQ